MDEYDKALVFALKKWIADEINEIYDNNVYAVGVGMEPTATGADAYICYNTEAHLKETGAGRLDAGKFKAPRFAVVDDDDAVFGSVDIWLRFKGFDKEDICGTVKDMLLDCVEQTFSELRADGIIKERFSKDIDTFVIR